MVTKNELNDRPALLRALRANWRLWTAAVERSARGGRCAPDAYVALHARLMACCARLAETAEEAALYRDLEEIARPWLTPGALQGAEREILNDLAARCREAGGRLGCWTWWDAVAPWLGTASAAVVGVAALVLAAKAGLLRPVGEWLEECWHWARLTAAPLADYPWAVPVLAVAIIFGAFFLTARAARS